MAAPLTAEEKRKAIVAVAQSALGTRWRHQGRIIGHSLDCVGLIVVVGQKVGLLTPDQDELHYRRVPDGRQLHQLICQYAVRKPWREHKPGDFVELRMDQGVMPCHLGILMEEEGELQIIHASVRRKKVVKHVFDDDMRHTVVALFSYPGLD